MIVPKMTLYIDLLGKTRANIKLLHITNMFIDKPNQIYTPNQWTYNSGNRFSVNTMLGTVMLPHRPNANLDVSKLSFTSDNTRKIMLKDFNQSVLEWSSNHFFKVNKTFHETPHIKYVDKLWVIY